MARYRHCETCGMMIHFIINSRGKRVPMGMLSGLPHFTECSMPPSQGAEIKPSIYSLRDELRIEQAKRSVYYKSSESSKRHLRAISGSKTLGEYK